MLDLIHKKAGKAVRREMRRQDTSKSVKGWDMFLQGKSAEEFSALQMMHWDSDSDVIKAVNYCAQYSEKILLLRTSNEVARVTKVHIRIHYMYFLSTDTEKIVVITRVHDSDPV